MHPVIAEIRSVVEALPELTIDLEEPSARRGDSRAVADAASRGILYFYDRTPVATGLRGIDWSGGHIAHQEWPAQLNRFHQLAPLAACYAEAPDESLARTARSYIEDWIDSHRPYEPTGPAAPGDSSLNMTIRLGCMNDFGLGWTRALEVFYGSEAFDDAFVEKVLDAIAWQLAWLRRHLAAGANWRIAGACGLLVSALMVSSRFGQYLPFARDELISEFYSQILPDGAHVERSAAYHDWMADTFVRFQSIGEKLGPQGWSLDEERMLAMDYHCLAHTRPNGAVSRFNDARGSTKPNGAPGVLEDQLTRHRILRRVLGRSDAPPLDAVFADAGLVFFRTSWESGATFLGFDACTAWAGGHLHLSRLSLELHHGGRTLLPDPAIFSYEMSKWEGAAGKKTAQHSTVNVDMLNQADVGARLVRSGSDGRIAYAQGRYEGGFWPGQYTWAFRDGHGTGTFGVHDRTVVWIKGEYAVVIDAARTEEGRRLYVHWQLDDSPWNASEDGRTVFTRNTSANLLVKLVPLPGAPPAELTVYEGDEAARLGWIAEEDDDVVPAPLLSWRFEGPAAEFVTLLVPFGTEPPELSAQTAVTPDGLARVLCVTTRRGTDRLFWTSNLARGLGNVECDAGTFFTRARLRLEQAGQAQPFDIVE